MICLRNAEKALLYGVFCLSVVLYPLVSKAADKSILFFMPAILSSAHETTPPPLPPPPGGGHESITEWKGTATCLECHMTEAKQVFSSVHYQWLGRTPYMNDGPDVQGKLDSGVNSYCINITGNWDGCGSCHAGLGKRPERTETREQLENIDCLICHQEQYKRIKENGEFVPDTASMSVSIVEAARTVHKPTRITCLQCHAKGGGGDNFKRGDMTLAHGFTADRNFDVHMATTGGNLNCGKCHTTQQHRIAGRGSDLRPTDLDVQMSCTDCHEGKDTINGHSDRAIGRHVAKVACQTCHIGEYARDAVDTAASEMTETHRDWRLPHLTASGATHPTPTMSGDLIPRYKWWNGTSSSYLLHDPITVDPLTGNIPTSRPLGDVNDAGSKLFPFKYKTAVQPRATAADILIALDTSVYFATGHDVSATASGLQNMGYPASSDYDWVTTDTYQLITHEVTPSSGALDCTSCHQSTDRLDLQGELGYSPKNGVCNDCHEQKSSKGFSWMHDSHVDKMADKGYAYDCSRCHTFSRP